MSRHDDGGGTIWKLIKLIAMIMVLFMLVHTDRNLREKYDLPTTAGRK